jgi:hypothetical protein
MIFFPGYVARNKRLEEFKKTGKTGLRNGTPTNRVHRNHDDEKHCRLQTVLFVAGCRSPLVPQDRNRLRTQGTRREGNYWKNRDRTRSEAPFWASNGS